MIVSLGDRLDVTIESLAFGGRGVARHAGTVLFVQGGVPGDRVRIRIQTVKKRHAEAVVESVIQAGANRRDPGCSAFGQCGGCQWLNVVPGAQALAKDDELWSSLTRIGKVKADRRDAFVSADSPLDLAYRSRAILRARVSGGAASFGFFAEGSRDLVPLPESCIVLEKELDAAVRTLAASKWPDGPFKAELTADGEGGVHVSVQLGDPDAAGRPSGRPGAFGPQDPATIEAYGRALAAFPHRILDSSGRVLVGGDPTFRITRRLRAGERELVLRARPGHFTQVHSAQNQRLIDRVLDCAALTGRETVLDLYAGAGNLALPLAVSAARVVAIEHSGGSVEDGRTNAKANELPHCEFLAGDVRRLLESGRLPAATVVVLDPPRSGAAESLAALAKLAPSRIVYVSCNPPTLARDLATLVASGFRLERAGAIDMFPQTFHVEAVALLTR